MATIMVCVTKQKTCQRLIKFGKLAMMPGDELHVVHVASYDYNFLGDSEENRALEFLYEQAREAGAELTVLKSNDTLGALCQLARDKHVDKFIMGSAPEQDVKSGFIGRLERKLNGSVEVITLPWESDQE